MLLLPAGGHLLDMAVKLPGPFFGALTIGLLYHIIQSMTSNAIRAGWGDWLPLGMLDAISKWVKSELDKKIQRAAARKGDVPSDQTRDMIYDSLFQIRLSTISQLPSNQAPPSSR